MGFKITVGKNNLSLKKSSTDISSDLLGRVVSRLIRHTMTHLVSPNIACDPPLLHQDIMGFKITVGKNNVMRHLLHIFGEGRITGFLDWESAGWYPDYWDFTTALRFTREDFWWYNFVQESNTHHQ
jgi:hypothetical protein